jgi:mRNA-degrading endonuclease RelE of RelBE toxin-antitoxin system
LTRLRGEALKPRWQEKWERRYRELTPARQFSCDSAIMALVTREQRPGLHVKPILPDKYFYEARISSGDRIIFRIESGTIFFYDIVKHDDVARYARAPRRGP